MPGTAAPEVAGAGDSSGGGHGGAGGSGPFDPEAERPRRRPTIGHLPGGTKGPTALGGNALVRPLRPEARNFLGRHLLVQGGTLGRNPPIQFGIIQPDP